MPDTNSTRESTSGEPASRYDRVERLFLDLEEIAFFEIALVIVGAWISISLLRWLLPFVASHLPSRLRLYVLGAVPIARLAIITGAVLWIIPLILNITFQNFLVIAGAAGVAIGFAFKDYISSLIAGVVAVFEKPYRPGDWVEASGHYGEVQHVGLRAISLRTPADDIVTVPNATLWNHSIVNSNDGDHTLLCVAHFYLDPLHDAQQVRLALEDVALTSAYLQYERPVVVILRQTPYGSHYQLKAYPFDMRDQFLFISDLTARGKQAVMDCGASEIAVPISISPPGRSATTESAGSDSAF